MVLNDFFEQNNSRGGQKPARGGQKKIFRAPGEILPPPWLKSCIRA